MYSTFFAKLSLRDQCRNACGTFERMRAWEVIDGIGISFQSGIWNMIFQMFYASNDLAARLCRCAKE